ncbi:hypothetical protein ANN_04441 [Periplaneta americana]|uniref:Uncharacterized protein n=1 Tax=Periplaneta americana TaxID=6978 RepID=A0ABQ8TA81_PERAM|nr:hypothetical protein ANN_04441 [Periplaneta americana]
MQNSDAGATTLMEMGLSLDHVGPANWKKEKHTSKEQAVVYFPEGDGSAVDEDSEGQAGMENTRKNHYVMNTM